MDLPKTKRFAEHFINTNKSQYMAELFNEMADEIEFLDSYAEDKEREVFECSTQYLLLLNHLKDCKKSYRNTIRYLQNTIRLKPWPGNKPNDITKREAYFIGKRAIKQMQLIRRWRYQDKK